MQDRNVEDEFHIAESYLNSYFLHIILCLNSMQNAAYSKSNDRE